VKITIDRKKYGGKTRPIWCLETDLIRTYRRMAVLTQNHRCFYCYGKITHENSTADHRVALARGGKTEAGNILASCKQCNTAKADLSYREFMECLNYFALPDADYNTRVHIWATWARRRLNNRLDLAEFRIKRAVGVAA
jgi:5-methylcytosine-specific restriction endonuclease McrA